MSKKSTTTIGASAERSAEISLKQHGLTLVARNFRCKFGEIDLIMRDNKYLVFIEVRYRAKSMQGSGLESITRTKQLRLTRTALFYLQQNQLMDKIPCRFDAIGMDKQGNSSWIKNAFSVQY